VAASCLAFLCGRPKRQLNHRSTSSTVLPALDVQTSDLFPIHDDHSPPFDLTAMYQFHQVSDPVEPLKHMSLDFDAVLGHEFGHGSALLGRAEQAPLQLDIPKDNLPKRNHNLVRLRDLDHGPVQPRDGTGQGRGIGGIRQHHGGIGALAARRGPHRLGDGLGAPGGVHHEGGADLGAQGQALGARIDADDPEAHSPGELHGEVAQTAAGSDEGERLALPQAGAVHGAEGGPAGAGQRGGVDEGHGSGQARGPAGVDDGVLGEEAVGAGDARHAAEAGAVDAPVLGRAGRAGAAGAAAVAGQTGDDAVAGPAGRRRPGGHDGAGALVRRHQRERRREGARLHHAVRVAVGRGGDLDQDVVRAEGRGRRHREGDEGVGRVEGRQVHRSHCVWEARGGHGGCRSGTVVG